MCGILWGAEGESHGGKAALRIIHSHVGIGRRGSEVVRNGKGICKGVA